MGGWWSANWPMDDSIPFWLGFSGWWSANCPKDDSIPFWLGFNDLEQNFLFSSNEEQISLLEWLEFVQKEWVEVGLFDITSDSFNSVMGADVDLRKDRNLASRSNPNDVSNTHPDIGPHNSGHSDSFTCKFVVDESSTDCLLTLLALDQNKVALIGFEFNLHCLRDFYDGAIVFEGLLHNDQLV